MNKSIFCALLLSGFNSFCVNDAMIQAMRNLDVDNCRKILEQNPAAVNDEEAITLADAMYNKGQIEGQNFTALFTAGGIAMGVLIGFVGPLVLNADMPDAIHLIPSLFGFSLVSGIGGLYAGLVVASNKSRKAGRIAYALTKNLSKEKYERARLENKLYVAR